jgi:glycerate dehydrogenase
MHEESIKTVTKNMWRNYNPSGRKRVIVTKELPGARWLEILIKSDCEVEVCTSTHVLHSDQILAAIGSHCDGVIGQLTEDWDDRLFAALNAAHGAVYSNYAAGFDNVDVHAATRMKIPVGNTPGVLTEATAEMAVALTFAAARRIGESERFLRAGLFEGWLPALFVGELLWGKTLGIIGGGRIGQAYACMMVEGHRMNLLYYDPSPNRALEEYVAAYGEFLRSQGQQPVSCRRTTSVEELLMEADCVSIHTVLNQTTYHLIDAKRLSLMKENAILINTSRGPVIDEAALVEHCRRHPGFHAGLDVFEDELQLKTGLAELDNVVLVPHIGSATMWTRQGMAVLAAANIAAMIMGYPVWDRTDVSPFLSDDPPMAAPSIVNAKELGLPAYR